MYRAFFSPTHSHHLLLICRTVQVRAYDSRHLSFCLSARKTPTHTHVRTYARGHARTHTCTYTHTHTHTHTRTYKHTHTIHTHTHTHTHKPNVVVSEYLSGLTATTPFKPFDGSGGKDRRGRKEWGGGACWRGRSGECCGRGGGVEPGRGGMILFVRSNPSSLLSHPCFYTLPDLPAPGTETQTQGWPSQGWPS